MSVSICQDMFHAIQSLRPRHMAVYHTFEPENDPELERCTSRWVRREMTNLEYLMVCITYICGPFAVSVR